jgi:hypothetical protein
MGGWLNRLKRRRLDDEDFAEEIRSHLAIAADERKADSADSRSASLASLKDFGNVTLTTEAARGVWTPRWLDALHDQMSDVRYAVRTLAKKPLSSLTVVGLAAAFGAGRLLASASVLFGVSATDAGAFARALALVLGAVAIATIVPAWRASRVNPLQALRHQ